MPSTLLKNNLLFAYSNKNTPFETSGVQNYWNAFNYTYRVHKTYPRARSDQNVVLKYRGIRASPEKIVARMVLLQAKVPWDEQFDPNKGLLYDDVILDCRKPQPDTRSTYQLYHKRVYYTALETDYHAVRRLIRKRYALYNVLNDNHHTDVVYTELYQLSKSFLHVLVAYQLLRPGGDLLIRVHSYAPSIARPLLIVLCAVFSNVRLFASPLHSPMLLGCNALCTGVRNYDERTYHTLEGYMLAAREGRIPSTVDFASLGVTPALAQHVSEQYNAYVRPIVRYSMAYGSFLSKWSHEDLCRTNLSYLQARQEDIGRHVATTHYHRTIPTYPKYTGKRTHVTYLYLVQIPGTPMKGVVDALYARCVTRCSTPQRMVFYPASDHVTIVYTSPFVAMSEYPNDGVTFALTLHPYERFLRCRSFVQSNTSDAQVMGLKHACARFHIKDHGDMFTQLPYVHTSLFRNKVYCPQMKYVTNTFHQPSATNHYVYKIADLDKLCRRLNVETGVAAEEISTSVRREEGLPGKDRKDSKDDDSSSSSPLVALTDDIKSHINRVYDEDFIYFQYPIHSSAVALAHTLYVVSPITQCQHFWHFMLGEFIPLVMLVVKYQAVTPLQITMYKMQVKYPQNVFYQELAAAVPHLRIQIHGDIERIDHNYTTLKPLDNVTYEELVRSGDTEQIRSAVAYIQELVARQNRNRNRNRSRATTSASVDRRENVVPGHVVVHIRTDDSNAELNRYYKTHYADKWGQVASFTQTHGATRRRVTNIHDVVNAVHQFYRHKKQVEVVKSDSAEPLFGQIAKYVNCEVLVMEHGASMFFVMFLRPGSTIVEIIPRKKSTNPNKAVQALTWLAKLGGHTLRRVIVEDRVAKVSVADVLACL